MYTTHPFRAGPGDVAVVRFRRWSPPQGTLVHLGGESSSVLSTAILDTDNLVLYDNQWTCCTFAHSNADLTPPHLFSCFSLGAPRYQEGLINKISIEFLAHNVLEWWRNGTRMWSVVGVILQQRYAVPRKTSPRFVNRNMCRPVVRMSRSLRESQGSSIWG
jgi:hypothetical protein